MIAQAVLHYLKSKNIAYQEVPHNYAAASTSDTAEIAHISGHRLAKGVLLKHGRNYALAVLPSCMQVNLDALAQISDFTIEMADESAVELLFSDCDLGAIPPLGGAYNIHVFLDIRLCDEPEIFFEAGDHKELLRVSEGDFEHMQEQSTRADFATRQDI
ncbi:MAG: YbaK/EbsC family protein [Mariprofundales bacterium]